MKSEVVIVLVITVARAAVLQGFDVSNLPTLNSNLDKALSQLNAALAQQQQQQQSSTPSQSLVAPVQQVQLNNPNIQVSPNILNQQQIQLNTPSPTITPNNPNIQLNLNVIKNPNNPNNPNNPTNIEYKTKFDAMKVKFGKGYNSPEEETYRYSVFVENLKEIQLFNARGQSYQKGINQFIDWTHQEFVDKMLMKNPPLPPIPTPSTPSLKTLSLPHNIPIPPFLIPNPAIVDLQFQKRVIIDWVTRRKVVKIKNQGYTCGSCWAFSAVGIVESNFAIQRGLTPVMLSESQLVDCCGVRGYGCNGCIASWAGDGLDYIAAVGLSTSLSYPYSGKVQTCNDKIVETRKYLQKPSFSFIPATQILTYLLKGPLSISLDAREWQFYTGGVFTGCPEEDAKVSINHAVILVGADRAGNWKLRNSWGVDWGVVGYMWISGVKDCGLTRFALYPNLLSA